MAAGILGLLVPAEWRAHGKEMRVKKVWELGAGGGEGVRGAKKRGAGRLDLRKVLRAAREMPWVLPGLS